MNTQPTLRAMMIKQRALRADFWRRERRLQLRRLRNDFLVMLAFVALVLAACLAIMKWIPR